MFVFSVKSTKLKFAALVILVVAVLISVIVLSSRDTAASSPSAVNYSAKDAVERAAFLAQFGWEVAEDPLEVTEVIIPAEFDAFYSGYNEIQVRQELDLKPYALSRVKRWTYAVKNYPGYEDDNAIRANILVCEGRVIGGDVCSIELGGFMHGFAKP